MSTSGDAPGRAAALILTAYVAYFYVFMEWLFFVTKPSFMDSFSHLGAVCSLLVPPLALLALGAPLALLLGGRAGAPRAGLLAPAVLLGATFFLMADNFVYTLTGWGVISSGSIARFALGGALLAAVFGGYRLLAGLERGVAGRLNFHRIVSTLLVAASGISLVIQVSTSDLALADVEVRAGPGPIRRPHIIFLGTDALSATFTSLYGHPLPTTPFLERLATESVVFENAFANAGKTTGSVVSMLAGKAPHRLKVGFPPQILPQQHAFQHLPAMLRRLGYRGFQRSIRFYGDGGDLNMQSAFERANLRDLPAPMPGSLGAKLLYVFNAESVFATRLRDRLVHRVLHVFGVKRMANHFLLVQSNEGLGLELDRRSIDRAFRFMTEEPGPFFLHLHLMGTHCCDWNGGSGWFEKNYPELAKQEQYAAWQGRMLGSVHDADELFEGFTERLARAGLLESSILIVSSDHTYNWDTDQRVPLLIRFPQGEPRGVVTRNVELVDLPATLLDYMGVEVPSWMSSRSLMDPDPSPTPGESELVIRDHRPIVSLARFSYRRYGVSGAWFSSMLDPGPPHYGVEWAQVVQCNQWLKLQLATGKIRMGPVRGHTDPCARSELAEPWRLRAWLRSELEREGFSFDWDPESRPLSGRARDAHRVESTRTLKE